MNQIGKLLQPSWLSGLTALTVSLIVVIGTIVTANYTGSDLRYIVDTEREKAVPKHVAYEPIQEGLSTNQLLSDLPLLIFWMGVGLIVYWLVSSVARALSRAVEFEQELGYLHVNRQTLVRRALIRFGVRIGILTAWIIYILITLQVLLPYAVALAAATKAADDILYSIGYGLVAIVVSALVLHLHVIFARLFMWRVRITSSLARPL